ncbi:VOC family protein [Akkermansiaceae bacterium]|nr:VOC family protein [bacterium]MDA7651214.1 VOC family protein [Akkermansiaceae bacterium]MDA8980913.1 VOC family protein [bacterium]MDA8991876.1 VOC family protein [Akkermansiaceae bacterium]MDB0056894.1 VOC family protein [Akkermansiaceae bacterium]
MTKKIIAFASLLLAAPAFSQEAEKPAPAFSSAVADIGIVVKDLKKSGTFYTETLGMTEVKGFSVPAEKAAGIGLTDNQPATIRVFVLDPSAKGAKTKFKLMSFPDAPGKMQDQKFIHSSIGVSYLTLYVTDMTAAVERLKKAEVKLLGKTPTDLGGGKFITVFHDPDGNFIELIGPME